MLQTCKTLLGAAYCCASALVALVLGGGTAEAQPSAYMANEGSNTVSVIDTASNTVVATIPVGNLPGGIAITPDASPTTREQCRNGGWRNFTNPTFNNQGQCIRFVIH